MKTAFTLLIGAILIAGGGVLYWTKMWPTVTDGNTTNIATTTTPIGQSPVTTTQRSPTTIATTTDGSHPGMKFYRNDEFGFEFWYPEGWELKENIFGSPYSKFNLTVMKIDGKYSYQDEIFNIITPEFADNAIRSFLSMGAATSSVVVNNVSATEYRGNFKSNPSPVVDIPFGKYRMLIAFEPVHEKELNSILSSFKFTK